jgi:hypothetical protein
MSSTFNSFSTTKPSIKVDDFLKSNSLIAKFAFFILVILGFVILLRVGITVLTFIFSPNESPHLINGMVNASQMLTFQQDPSNNNAVTIYRSNNASDGLEFTWSIWLYIEKITTSFPGIYRHIFSKGNSNLEDDGRIFPNNAPGLYICPNTNDLVVIMNTFNVINEELIIPDVPLNKWFNLVIRCDNQTFDAFINLSTSSEKS